MTDQEIRTKFDNMWGDEDHKIRIIKNLTGKTTKEIRDILTEQRAADVTKVYHADENPYCTAKITEKIETRVIEEPEEPKAHGRDLPETVLDLLFERLDTLEQEIKAAEAQKAKLEKEFTELVEFIGGNA